MSTQRSVSPNNPSCLDQPKRTSCFFHKKSSSGFCMFQILLFPSILSSPLLPCLPSLTAARALDGCWLLQGDWSAGRLAFLASAHTRVRVYTLNSLRAELRRQDDGEGAEITVGSCCNVNAAAVTFKIQSYRLRVVGIILVRFILDFLIIGIVLSWSCGKYNFRRLLYPGKPFGHCDWCRTE